MNTLRASLSVTLLGCVPSSTSASMLPEKLACSAVFLKRLFCTTAGTASFLSSITMRMPSRSVSSRRSAMPSSFLSFTRSAIFSNKPINGKGRKKEERKDDKKEDIEGIYFDSEDNVQERTQYPIQTTTKILEERTKREKKKKYLLCWS